MIAYVGGYTTPQRHGRAPGLVVYRVDEHTGDWSQVQVVKDLVNPSWLTLDRAGRRLYVAQGDGDEASAWAIDEAAGTLRLLNRQSTGGTNSVSLAVDPTQRFVVAANYTTGSVAVMPVLIDGSLAPVSDLVRLEGTPGPHPTQQASAHPHHVVFEPHGRFLVVPDKGLDATFVFRLDAATGTLVAGDPPSMKAQPGAGPRHAAFHPAGRHAYILNELDSTITTCRVASGTLEPVQVISTRPPDFTGTNTTSEIVMAPSGRYLYGSNRGHDSIAIFAVDAATGTLSAVGWEPTRGRTPRFFALDPSGAHLHVANQDTDTIVVFLVDRNTGALTATGHVVTTGSPSAIAFRRGE